MIIIVEVVWIICTIIFAFTIPPLQKFLIKRGLPKGHRWTKDVTFCPSSSYSYECEDCGQIFHSGYNSKDDVYDCQIYGVLGR